MHARHTHTCIANQRIVSSRMSVILRNTLIDSGWICSIRIYIYRLGSVWVVRRDDDTVAFPAQLKILQHTTT